MKIASEFLVLVIAAALAACGGDSDDSLAARQDEVAERGATVMPFDLDATTHRFEPTSDGLIETVRSDDATDAKEIELVRTHLRSERERFESGDYGDPQAIHGADMPGLSELSRGTKDIDIVFEEVDAGARLVFTSDDPDLVDALHRWGEAQTSDHGEHAE